jgi:iron(III) transport system permease protein
MVSPSVQYQTSGTFRLPRMTGWQISTMLICLLVLVPLVTLFLSFLHPEKEIWDHILQTQMSSLLINTLFMVVGVAVCTTIIGVSLAWLTGVCEFPGRRFFSWALLLPMAMPTYVLAFVWLGLLDFPAPLPTALRTLFGADFRLPEFRSLGGVIQTMTLALYPYVYLLAKNGFATQGARAMEAAESLGCTRTQAFFRVALPMAWPWIAGGVLLVVMESLADFGAVSIFNFDTFTTAIYKAWYGFFSLPAAAQLSTVLIVLVFIIMELDKRSRKKRQFYQSERQQTAAPRIQLSKRLQWVAGISCSLILLLGFGLPLIQLLYWAVSIFEQEFSTRYLSLLLHSASLAIIAALIIVFLAFILAYTSRRHPGTITQLLIHTATLGYGLPGTVLAVGIYIPISGLDNILITIQEKLLGSSSSFLQGTVMVMLLAYTIRFLAAGFKAVDSAMHRITPSIDEAARLMGLRGPKILLKIHLPIIKGGALTALTMVFVDVMKEMPITLMTRPFGWDTLSVKVFELTSEGEWERAAIPALFLVITGLLPIIFFMRKSES